MPQEVIWSQERAEHIQSRSQRYPGAFNIEPAWTSEALSDPERIVQNPDPKSHTGAMRVVGYSSSAHAVLTVILDRRAGRELQRGRPREWT